MSNAQTLIDEYTAKTLPNSVSPTLTAEMAQAVLDECHKTSFIAVSSDTIPVSENDASLSIVTGLSLLSTTNGFIVDSATGSVKNTGADIDSAIGSISYQPSRTGGGAANSLYIISEISTDGITWTKNLNSARKIEIPSDGETFKTSVSFVEQWLSGEYLRFKFYTLGGGSISFTPESVTLEGEVISGYSIVWVLGG